MVAAESGRLGRRLLCSTRTGVWADRGQLGTAMTENCGLREVLFLEDPWKFVAAELGAPSMDLARPQATKLREAATRTGCAGCGRSGDFQANRWFCTHVHLDGW